LRFTQYLADMKKTLRLVLLFILAAGFIYTLYFLYQKSEEKPVLYTTQIPFKTSIVRKTVATGSVVPRREVNIKPRVSGIIDKLFVVAGNKVHKGDKIAQIRIVPNMLNLNEAEARVSRASSQLDNSKIDFERNKKLYESGMISLAEFQPYQLTYKNAKTELDAAENNLALIKDGISKSSGKVTNTIVTSTIDGIVLDVPLKEGSSVIESNTFNEGTTIAVVADLGEMIFEGKVDESEVGKISTGMKLILNIGAIENQKFDADLEYIAPKGVKDNGAIQFQIKAMIHLKEGLFIRAGYSATADIVLDTRDSVWAISESLIQFEKDERAYVEVETSPQTFEKRYIKTGLSDGINTEILSGIKPGDKIKDPTGVEKNEEQHDN